MNRFRLLPFAALLAGGLALSAQTPPPSAEAPPSPMQRVASTGGWSPHETRSLVIGKCRVTLVYGRPYTRNPKTGEVRKVWGGLVPYGKVWRTGADEATLLITQKPLDFGGTLVPAGAYTLFTLPQEDGSAQLIINRQIGQWGLQYDPSQDLARIPLQKNDLTSPVDQFTMSLTKDPATHGGVLSLKWETREYSTGFTLVP